MIDITRAALALLGRSPDPVKAWLDVLRIVERNPAVQTVVLTTRGGDVLGALRISSAGGVISIRNYRELAGAGA